LKDVNYTADYPARKHSMRDERGAVRREGIEEKKGENLNSTRCQP